MPTMPIFNKGRVLWQSAENDDELPNEAIAVHVDNGGTLLIEQAGSTICVNRSSLRELCATLGTVTKEYEKGPKR